VERTLSSDIVAFAESLYTVDRCWLPDGRTLRKHPIRLLDWQKRQLWEVFPPGNGGRPAVRNYLDSENKKLGKSTKGGIVAAYLAATEPNSEVYICAADKQQARDRVFKSVKYAVEHGPLGDYATAYRDRIEFSNGAVIQAFPMDYRGAAGGEPVAVIFDELHTYSLENMTRLWDEMVIPPTLEYGIRWVASYAGWSGESILLKEVWDKVKAGQLQDGWPEPIRAYRNDAAGWWGMITQGEAAYQLVPWGQGERGRQYLAEARRSERLPSYARLFRNEWAQSENAFCPVSWWEACLDPELRPLSPNKTIPLSVGVDAACYADGDDMAAIGVYDNEGRVSVAWHKVWRGGKARRERIRLDKTIEPYLLEQAARYNIRIICYDPRFMVNIADRLRDGRLPMCEIVQSLPWLGPIGQNLYSIVQDGRLRYYDHDDVKGMATGAVAKEVASGLHIKKRTGQADLLVALSFACIGLEAAITPMDTEEVIEYKIPIDARY
jgi:phage terminase large subunit-like protein